MAKDDIDLDMSIFDDTNDFSMAPADTKTRKPAEKVAGNIKDAISGGAPAAVKGVGKHILKNMPAGSSLASDLSDTKGILSETAGEVREELSKYFVTTKRATGLALPYVKKILPSKLYQKVENFSKVNKADSYKGPTGEETESARVSGILDEMFSAQTSMMADDIQRKTTDNMVDKATEALRHKKSINVLASINEKLAYNNKFLGGIHQSWMRKVLELKYMHLYTAKETLSVLKVATESMNIKMDAIVKNTSLPDIVKTKSAEFLSASIRGKITDRGVSALSDITKKLQGKVKEALGLGGSLNDALNMSMDMKESMSGMGPGFDDSPAKKIGKLVGSGIGYIGGKRLVEPLRPIHSKLDRMSSDFSDKIKTGGRDIRDKMLHSNNPFMNFIGDLLPTTTANLSVGNDLLEKGGEASIFDNATRQSIVEIIPLWLSKIAKNTRDIATGKDTEQEIYDVTKRKITTIASAKESIENRMLGDKKTRSEGIIQSYAYIKKAVAGNKNLKNFKFKDVEKDILKFIDNAVANGITINPKVIKEYAKFFEEEEIRGYQIDPLVDGVKNKVGVIQMLNTLLYDENGRLDDDAVSLINRGISAEQRKDNMKKNFSKFIEDFGAYHVYSDDITAGSFSAEKLSAQRLNIDKDKFNEGVANYEERYTQERRIIAGQEESFRNNKFVKGLAPKYHERATKIANKNITGVSTFARLFEESTGIPYEDIAPIVENMTDEEKEKLERKAKNKRWFKEKGKKFVDAVVPDAIKKVIEKQKKDEQSITNKTKGKVKSVIDNQKNNENSVYRKGKKIVGDATEAAADKVTDILADDNSTKRVKDELKKLREPGKKKLETAKKQSKEYLDQAVILTKQAKDIAKGLNSKNPEEVADAKEKVDKLLEEANKLTSKAKKTLTNISSNVDEATYKSIENSVNNTVAKIKETSSNIKKGVVKTHNDIMARVPPEVRERMAKRGNTISAYVKKQKDAISKNAVELAEEASRLTEQAKTIIVNLKNKDPEEIERLKKRANELLDKAKDLAAKAIIKADEILTDPKGVAVSIAAKAKAIANDVIAKFKKSKKDIEQEDTTTPKDEEGNWVKRLLKKWKDRFFKGVAFVKNKLLNGYNVIKNIGTKAADEDPDKPKKESKTKAIIKPKGSDKYKGSDTVLGELSSYHKAFLDYAEVQHADNLIMIDTLVNGGFFGFKRLGKGITGLLSKTGRGIKGAAKMYKDIYVGAAKGLGMAAKAAGGVAKTALAKGIPALGSVLGKALTGGAHLGGKALDMMGSFYKGAWGFGKEAVKKLPKFISFTQSPEEKKFFDVYRKGEVNPGKPIISVRQQQTVAIRSDGKRLTCTADITMPVLNGKTKKTLVAQDDIDHGLVNIDNVKLSKAGKSIFTIGGVSLGGMGKGLLKVITGGMGLAKGIAGAYGAVAKIAGSGLKGLYNLADNTLTKKRYAPIVDKLSEIYKLLDERMKKRKKGDTDGDEDRDGSYEDQMKNNKSGRGSEPKKDANGNYIDKDDNPVDKNGNPISRAIGKKAKGLLNKHGGKLLQTAGNKLLAKNASSKIGGALVKQGVGMAAKSAATTAGSAMLGGAATAGTAAAGAAGTAAAGAAGGVAAGGLGAAALAAAPWLLGAAAVGGIGYLGYRAIKKNREKKQMAAWRANNQPDALKKKPKKDKDISKDESDHKDDDSDKEKSSLGKKALMAAGPLGLATLGVNKLYKKYKSKKDKEKDELKGKTFKHDEGFSKSKDEKSELKSKLLGAGKSVLKGSALGAATVGAYDLYKKLKPKPNQENSPAIASITDPNAIKKLNVNKGIKGATGAIIDNNTKAKIDADAATKQVTLLESISKGIDKLSSHMGIVAENTGVLGDMNSSIKDSGSKQPTIQVNTPPPTVVVQQQTIPQPSVISSSKTRV